MKPLFKPQWRRAAKRVALALPLALPLLGTATAHAFSGEDPVFGHPWYHEKITREAAKQVGFSSNALKDVPDTPKSNVAAEIIAMLSDDPRRGQDSAAEAIAWHADYIDSYLYNPLWWAKDWSNTGIHRYKAVQSIEGDLVHCHFDDLFSTEQVNAMWRRYASGTFAGLMWASEQNGGKGDIHAAQNILGVSLHAMQDFYAHSSWVDKPERREKTFFQYALAARSADNIYTGAYEKDHQLGVKPHGKWIPQNAIWGQPGVKQVMEVACDPLSPFGNSDACAAWKEVKAGTPMKPTVGGIKLPSSIMVYTPAGIALDNTWVADEAINQRGIGATIGDVPGKTKGRQAFDWSYNLALQQSVQWLKTLEAAMKSAGKQDFWDELKRAGATDKERTDQYENYGQFPFLFLSAGGSSSENTGTAPQWFLRLKIKTAKGRTAGTNADIKVRAGGKVFPLDYAPNTTPILAYNDFEAGDNDAYVVGPFNRCPDSLDLINDAGDAREIFEAAGRDFVGAIVKAADVVGDLLLDIVGGHADKIAVNKQLWMPEDFAAMPLAKQAKATSLSIGGIKFPSVPKDGKPFQIRLNGDKEGDYEARGTIRKVGEDESNYQVSVSIDSLYCYKESKMDRFSFSDEVFMLCALNPFPGNQQSWRSPVYENFDDKETRGVAHTFETISVPKSSGMLNLAITLMESDDESEHAREELMQKFAGTYDEQTKNARRSFTDALTTSIAAEWKVQHLEVTAFNRNGLIHEGTVFDEEVNRWVKPKIFQTFNLNPAGAVPHNVTTEDLLPFLGDPTPVQDKPQEPTPAQPQPDQPAPPAPAPSIPVPAPVPITPPTPTTPIPAPAPVPPVPTIPTLPTEAPNTPGVPTTPTNGATGTFRPLGDWGVNIESTRIARGNQIEVIATYKNVSRQRQSLEASVPNMVITDADGVGIQNIGNLYRASGDPDMEPEQMQTGLGIEPGNKVKLLALFDLPRGMANLKTLTVFGYRVKPLTYDISTLQLPDPIAGVSFPVTGAVAANTTFFDVEGFGIRLDGVRRGRGDILQVFVTVQNRHPDLNLYASHPYFDLDVSILDADGLSYRNEGNLYRASGTSLDLVEMQSQTKIVPGGQTTVCYQVHMPKGAVPKQILLKYDDKKFSVNLPTIP